ncbi:hypothetical protein [Flavobacterium aquiphilum]|uniref:hypothetical protein n=1 Tax=Flavobacterium aquiphilum TaxID=3003261 RepID=UPI002480C3F4|nr:hypothetical protein [Flavobacterium aquiphilum]
MEAIQFPQQKEMEAAISELRSFMDITAVTLHEANVAGKSGYILTIILEENSNQIACEMYDWADKIFKRHLEITYRIVNILDVQDYLKNGNLYYVKWYLSKVVLFKNGEFNFKIQNGLPKTNELLSKAEKKNIEFIAKAESLKRGAQHYEGTNNHQMALYTIHQAISLLFHIVGELTMGKPHVNPSLLHHLNLVKNFAPILNTVLNGNNAEDKFMMELLDKVNSNFPFKAKTRIKKETVKAVHKKLHNLLKTTKKIYQTQLSYCQERIVGFIEPKKGKANLEEIVVNDEAVITNAITSYLKTEAIYCFNNGQTKPNHFYLLIFTQKLKDNAVHDLADIIKSKTDGRCTATLLIHPFTELKTKQPDQLYFFLNVKKKGKVLFRAKQTDLISLNQTLNRDYKESKDYLQYRNIIVNNMRGWQDDYEWACYSPLKGVMLHYIIEQICLGMIRLFMGYFPNHFALSYLLEICDYINPKASIFFSRLTEQDRNLFQVLSRSYPTLRYCSTDSFSDKDMDLLEERCNDFAQFANNIVKTELERIEKLEPKV